MSWNLTRAFVLKGKSNIGYIHLPGFYVGCGLDLMREVIKLSYDSIDGIILDLTGNGGGSVQEVQEIASTFIPEGAFAGVSSTVNGFHVLQKIKTGIVFKDPLLVLVDMSSASSSELLTGILKEFDRAIIVGTNTFGKGTAQIVTPLSYKRNEKLGYIKVTTDKMHLLNGESFQLNGVQPHIKLPYIFDTDMVREKAALNAIQPDTILGDTSFISPECLPINFLAANSSFRLDTNQFFKSIVQIDSGITQIHEHAQSINLNISQFKVNAHDRNELYKAFEKTGTHQSSFFSVDNSSMYSLEESKNKDETEINSLLKKQITNNIYIEECFFILNDLLDYKKREDASHPPLSTTE